MKNRRWIIFILVIIVIITGGCSKSAKKDTFLDKWKQLAETSQGHSPVREKSILETPKASTPEVTKAPVAGQTSDAGQTPPPAPTPETAQAPVVAPTPAPTADAGQAPTAVPSPAPTAVENKPVAESVEVKAGVMETSSNSKLISPFPSYDIADKLPTVTVTIKMNNIDLPIFLKEFARTGGVNMLVKEDIKGAVTMDIKDVPWNNAFKSILTLYNLNYIWEGDIIRIVNKESMDSELGLMAAMDKHRAQIEHSREVGVLHAAVIQIDYAGEDIENLSKSIIELLTKDDKGKPIGTISINKHNNALIINALDDDMLKIAKLIESIDKPIPQILIKANIIESTSDTARELGFQWGGMHKAGENTFIGPGGLTKAGLNATTGRLEYNPANATTTLIDHGYGLNHPSATGETSKTALGLITGVPGISLLEMQLTALQKDNKLNIIASPSLTTLDNHKSFTESGVKVPFVTVDEKGNRFVKFEDSVLRLEITPHVIDNRNILLKIIVKKDEVDTSRAVEGNPFIIKKMSETSLIVEDGETIVISGLNKHTNLQSNKGTPFLKDIPIIGKLFSANSNGNTMEEVLIFITPHILPPQKAQTAKKE